MNPGHIALLLSRPPSVLRDVPSGSFSISPRSTPPSVSRSFSPGNAERLTRGLISMSSKNRFQKSIDLSSCLPHNKVMLPLTKGLWAVNVWMTAITTLFASISPCQCVCPDGHRKLFCLGITCGTKGCCCCGTCCDSAREQGCRPNVERTCVKATNQRSCCCQGTSPRDSAATAEHSHVQGKGCRLTLSQAELVTDSRKDIAVNDCSVESLFRETPSLVLPISLTCPLVWSYETYRPPPPPDLIVIFQHFVV